MLQIAVSVVAMVSPWRSALVVSAGAGQLRLAFHPGALDLR
jgi:hypothetical protein